MARRILDTSVLVQHWKRSGGHAAHVSQSADVRAWADELAKLYGTRAIVSPVYLEFICGTTTREQLELARRFLSEFEIIDHWQVRTDDLREAQRIAERIPRSGRRRQLGDCLIRALANRLSHDVVTHEKAFPT